MSWLPSLFYGYGYSRDWMNYGIFPLFLVANYLVYLILQLFIPTIQAAVIAISIFFVVTIYLVRKNIAREKIMVAEDKKREEQHQTQFNKLKLEENSCVSCLTKFESGENFCSNCGFAVRTGIEK